MSLEVLKNTSVITLCAGREEHLSRLIAGLANSISIPYELIIVFMGESTFHPPNLHFPIKTVHLPRSSSSLPLAAARNLGAKNSSGENLVFLDVDCIPAPNLVSLYAEALSKNPSYLLSGTVRYLCDFLPASPSLPSPADLDRLSAPHRLQKTHTKLTVTDRYELFWSLNFALTRATWEKIGGFDEAFSGYGAEDTDFAFTARAQNIPLAHLPAKAWHQHHHTEIPPRQHLESIVKNARCFHEKWGIWPMESWLQAFSDQGLIRFLPQENILELLSSAESSAAPPSPLQAAQA